jgi:hypothetical protein
MLREATRGTAQHMYVSHLCGGLMFDGSQPDHGPNDIREPHYFGPNETREAKVRAAQ